MNHQITLDTLMDHITGKKTIGVYEIGLDDDVTWGCFDIDSHAECDDGTEARGKVGDLAAVMEVYGVPYMLESSGSPGSYHVWILFKQTQTYNAYRFMRQLAREAKVKDIEIWPKQKCIGKDAKYGNLVKLPICLHNKTGNRSAFLDADTFEPLGGKIQVPGRVHLLEIPEITPRTVGQRSMPKATEPTQSPISSTTLDHCMVCALADGVQLEGSEGHHLRLAIAIKAQKIGMTEDKAVSLFRGQKDFDPDFTRQKIGEIWSRDYSPMSCETLRDRCGDLVGRYCSTCPFARARPKGVGFA